jgi:hypothetical protein
MEYASRSAGVAVLGGACWFCSGMVSIRFYWLRFLSEEKSILFQSILERNCSNGTSSASAKYGNSTPSLQIETSASSFFTLPYHQLERVDFVSANGTDTITVSFVTCSIRVIGKSLHRVASLIATQEVKSISVTPKKSPPPEKHSACIDKIEVVEEGSKLNDVKPL